MKRFLAVLAVAGAAPLLMTGPAAAHTQTVSPPGQETAVVDRGIARPWIQGHCRAQSPAVSGVASGGVVVFSPQMSLPCTGVLNPGGQPTGP